MKLKVLTLALLAMVSCKTRSYNTIESEVETYRKPIRLTIELKPGVTNAVLKNTQFLSTSTNVPDASAIPAEKKCAITGSIEIKYKIWMSQIADGHYYVTLWNKPASAGKGYGNVANLGTECPFQRGWISASQFNITANAFDKPIYEYDANYGQTLATKIQADSSCGVGGIVCYKCVADAIDKSNNAVLDFGSLNENEYAKSFAKNWVAERDEPKFHLTMAWDVRQAAATLEEGYTIAKNAPVGSVIVWNKCAGHIAGHIAVVIKKQYAFSSTQGIIYAPSDAHTLGASTCPGNDNPDLAAVFYPFRRKK